MGRLRLRTNLRTRFALAFATVAAVVAATVGLLSFHAASERIDQEIDSSLRSASVALANGQTDVLVAPGPPGRRGRPQARPRVAQVVEAAGAITPLGTSGMRLPVSDHVRSLAASGTPGQTDVLETDVTEPDRSTGEYRILTTSLADGRGALQVGIDVEQSERLLAGTANEIAVASTVVLVVAALAGWLLAGRITRRLEGLAGFAEEVSVHGGIDRQVPVEGHDEVARLAASFNTMLGRRAEARDAQ